MARSKSVLVCVFAVLLVASAQAQLQQQCMNYFGGLGGEEGISKLVPTCKQGMRGIRGCCSEVKALVDAGPEGCLCNEAVWEEMMTKIQDAGINGLTRERMNTFANICGIAHAGGGSCRRAQRSRARSSIRGSSGTTRRSNNRN